MSHHFSPEFTVLPPGKEPVSKKLQRNNDHTSSARQRETQKLDFDNKQMEWKLNQIRQVMSKEKEDRGKQHSIWKSGSAKIESHSRNILGRTVSVANVNEKQKVSLKSGTKPTQKSSQVAKVRVLRDEPLDLPERNSLAKELNRRFNHETPPLEKPSKSRELETPKRLEYWIRFAVDKNSADVIELQSDPEGNLQLSTVRAMEPAAVGVYFMKWGRKRLLIAADGAIRKPKAGWGDEIYYPYIAKSLLEMPRKPEPPLRNVSNTLPMISPPNPRRKQNGEGGKLLDGDFDEEKNAASFQQALKEWRHSGQQEENDAFVEESTRYTIKGDGKIREMAVHVAQCTPEPFEVKFSETSTLSYMEHILLQKHRKSQIPPLPKSFSETVNSYLDNELAGDNLENNFLLTEEEEEERQRYRELFIPGRKNHGPGVLQETLTIDEIDSEEDLDSTDQCIVDESPSQSPAPETSLSNQTVVIEEVSFDTIEYLESPVVREQKHVMASALKSKKMSKDSPSPNLAPENISGNNVSAEEHHKNRSKSAEMKVESVPLKSAQTPRSKTATGRAPPKELTSDEGRSISYDTYSLVHEIGKIPINPDAIYHGGLNQFFAADKKGESDLHSEIYQSHFNNFPEESILTKTSKKWNPLKSVVESDLLSPGFSPPVVEAKPLSTKENEEYDGNSSDEKALDDLEWELASRVGNITNDGRISRLIDEWSEDDDLEIIDDPGVGSGLSTPNVHSNCLSRVSMTDPNDPHMQYDFQNMEHVIMADMSDEYIGDEV